METMKSNENSQKGEGMIKQILLHIGFGVSVLDENGIKIPEYTGFLREKAEKIKKAIEGREKDVKFFHDTPDGSMMKISRATFEFICDSALEKK